jgi:DNA-binding transcriptional LysR family regulator
MLTSMPTTPPDDLIAVPDGAWSALELRHLHALLAVADEGTFSRAAARLGYTQSAVSQQIGGLERMVGTPLFDRPGGPRPVALTEAGHAMVDHARGVLSRLGAAQAELAAISAGERGRIRVGTVQSVGTQVLPALLSQFREQRPGVEIVLRESHDVHVLLRAVAEGELDVTFTEVEADSRFHTRHMLDDPFVFVAPRDSALASRASVSLGEVADLPMIGYRDVVCRTVVEQVFQGEAAPVFVFRSDDNPTIQGCVASGIGYWVTAALTVDADDPAVAVVPVVPAPEPRHIALAWPADRRTSPAVAQFVDVAEAVCRAVEHRTTAALRRPGRRPTTAA